MDPKDLIRTPVMSDKALWLNVATVVSILALDLFGIHISVETLMTIGGLVVTFTGMSKGKSALVAMAVAKQAGTSAAASVVDLSDAAKVIEAPK